MGLIFKHKSTFWCFIFMVLCPFSSYGSTSIQGSRKYGCYFEGAIGSYSPNIFHSQFGNLSEIRSLFVADKEMLTSVRRILQEELTYVLENYNYNNMNEFFEFYDAYQKYKINMSLVEFYEFYNPGAGHGSMFNMVLAVLNKFLIVYPQAKDSVFFVAAHSGITGTTLNLYKQFHSFPKNFKTNHIAGAVRFFVDEHRLYGNLVIDPTSGIPRVGVIMDHTIWTTFYISDRFERDTAPSVSMPQANPAGIKKLRDSIVNYAHAELPTGHSVIYYLSDQLCSFVNVPIKTALLSTDRFIIRHNRYGYPNAKVSYSLSTSYENKGFLLNIYNGFTFEPFKSVEIPFPYVKYIDTFRRLPLNEQNEEIKMVHAVEGRLNQTIPTVLNESSRIAQDFFFLFDLESLINFMETEKFKLLE